MDLQHACAAMLDEVDGSLGCIVIDTQTGLTVAAEYRPGSAMDANAISLVSVVSTNMFCGKLIRQFQRALANDRGPSIGFVREVQMTTANTNQFMAAIPGWNEGIFVLVTDKSVSLGLGWMAVHRVIGRLGDAPAPSEATASGAQWGTRQYRPVDQEPMQAPAPARAAAPPAVESMPSESPAVAYGRDHNGEYRMPAGAAPEPYGGSVHSRRRAPGVAAPPTARQPATSAAPPAGDVQAQGGVAEDASADVRPAAGRPVGARRAPAARARKQAPAEPKAQEAVPLGPRMSFMARKRKK